MPQTVEVILGAQWGDEGKGKLCDILSAKSDICARSAGGNNAGHTIVVNYPPGKGLNGQGGNVKYDFHLLPSGLVNENCIGLIGSGVVVHVPSFFEELSALESKGLSCASRVLVSDRAHLVFDFHQVVDGLKEVELGCSSIGTTKKGIGPAYSSKASRSGLRVHHLIGNFEDFSAKFRSLVASRRKRYGDFEYDIESELKRYEDYSQRLKPFIVDGLAYLHKALSSNPPKKILVEGANALMLDLDFGTYPYVTSSSASIGGVLTGLGLPPRAIGDIYGVVKAYTTRVGGGPFPTELTGTLGEYLQEAGAEWGTTTGRRRRCGWLDIMVLRHSQRVNGYTYWNLTKLDVLDDLDEVKIGISYELDGNSLDSFPADLDLLTKVKVKYLTLPGWKKSIKDCKSFQELPIQCQDYVKKVEELTQLRVRWIGIGPGRDSMIHRY
ncbi:P-loop containing nucleoside triphosphate hydrolase protein [Phakopsora pachyrhizi]|uniref:Adenylosuccinate synthetase n=1 Tax=Phakopsora pachyrhizi TaxID=170000 RepID=A0AAV0BE77_PHAPC|nr:P-loop containing nucleoside triphosphate hydrolase protein [Phakopsora pachyrhizi]CAH7685225.1 P-loop containing nucleoside triphosphate hydrolase protein [Phakopsora pachyrhizi]